jgi:hypothetical protein
MIAMKWSAIAGLVITVLIGACASMQAQSEKGKGRPAHVTVTVVRRNAKAPSTLTASDILVYQKHVRRPVLSWVAAQSPNREIDLAIFVDDSTGDTFGNQISYLKHFILSLPSSTRVAVAYAMHSDASILQGFTSDHTLASKALRLPLGLANEESSIYMAISDLVKHFPSDNRVHDVLLISDGIDLYRGVMDSEPGLNPDLNAAIQDAARANLAVFTIFANAAGLYSRNLFLINNGQSCLSLLTLDTGGESFFQGLQTPVSFQPFLQQLAKLLSDQYVLTFIAAPVRKSGLSSVHVTTEQPDVQLLAPQSVYVPAS